MGVNLTPIMVEKKIVNLDALRGRAIAVDANNELYQFLALIRTRNGTPLKDRDGNITSHLAGLIFRSTRLIHDYQIRPVFIFDGLPPKLKEEEIVKRRKVREKATDEWMQALREGDLAKAYSKAVMTSRLTQDMIRDAKRLLTLLGIPHIQAPGEAEAQAAYMTSKGDVWATGSRDYDSILFGTPRLIRFITISGAEYLPSKGVSRPIKPEIIETERLLSQLDITRMQLIDLAILIGTDFNEGVKGVGPKGALKLIKRYGSLEELPEDIRSKIPIYYKEVRRIFLKPTITDNYTIKYQPVDRDGLYRFLCEERDFSEDSLTKAIDRMEKAHSQSRQSKLSGWM